MQILIIEDDEYKAKQLYDYIVSNYNLKEDALTIEHAYQTGMTAIINNKYDLIILDMSIPNFEESNQRSIGRHRPYGGRDILNEMSRKEIEIPTIVVTQFSIFGEGEECLNQEQLNEMLKNDYPQMYLGMVYYNASLRDWKEKLSNIIIKLKAVKKRD